MPDNSPKVAQKLQDIASKHGYECELTYDNDGSLIDAAINKGGLDLYVVIPRHEGEYYAYGLSSSGLPREIYPDNVRAGVTKEQRSNEILQTVDKLLGRKIRFTHKPGVFNRASGFIVLSIDGRETKIPLKNNYFGLPDSRD
jgi:hypothetical protein